MNIDAELQTAEPVTDTRIHNSIVGVLEEMGLSDVFVNGVENMMGGHLCRVETDHIGLLAGNRDTQVVETSVREQRFWHSLLGTRFRRGRHVAFQGEWGTYGEMSDVPDIVRLQVWVGRFAVPQDVTHAFSLEHDRLVAQGAASRIFVAASLLQGVSDESLANASTAAMTDLIAEQVGRLSKAQ